MTSYNRVKENILFVIPDADKVAGWGEGIPGDVKPARARQELVGVLPILQERHEFGELFGILRTDIGSLADEVLGIAYTPYLLVHRL